MVAAAAPDVYARPALSSRLRAHATTYPRARGRERQVDKNIQRHEAFATSQRRRTGPTPAEMAVSLTRSDGPSAFIFRERGADDGEAAGTSRAAPPLHGARGDELSHVLCHPQPADPSRRAGGPTRRRAFFPNDHPRDRRPESAPRASASNLDDPLRGRRCPSPSHAEAREGDVDDRAVNKVILDPRMVAATPRARPAWGRGACRPGPNHSLITRRFNNRGQTRPLVIRPSLDLHRFT